MTVKTIVLALSCSVLLGCSDHRDARTAVLFHDYPLGADLPGRPLYRLELDGKCLYVRSEEDDQRLAVAWPESTASWDDGRQTLTLDGVSFQDGDLISIVYSGPLPIRSDRHVSGSRPSVCDYGEALIAIWTQQRERDYPPGFPHEVPEGSMYSDYALRVQFGSVEKAMESRVLQEASHGVRNELRELAPKRVVSLKLEHEPEMHIVATYTGPIDTLPDASKIVAESPLPIEFRSADD